MQALRDPRWRLSYRADSFRMWQLALVGNGVNAVVSGREAVRSARLPMSASP
jgi:hypothetical protein